jgi:death-on-curing protein
MSEPKWLTRAEVERIHDKVIEVGGGSDGLRDASLLESALARPKNHHAYGENDRFQLAASYAESISRNHAFVDGNKRTAWTAAEVFLRKHGKAIKSREDDQHAEMMENLGQGKITREQAAEYLRENSKELLSEKSQSDKAQEMAAHIEKTRSPIGKDHDQGK